MNVDATRIAREAERAELQVRYDRCKELEAAAQARIAKLEPALLNLLRAPYREWYPYAIGIACDVLDHPMRYEETPKFKENRCVCGKVVEEGSDNMTAKGHEF